MIIPLRCAVFVIMAVLFAQCETHTGSRPGANFVKRGDADFVHEVSKLKIDDLMGVWSTDKIDSSKFFGIPIDSVFRPASGFIIRYDSLKKMYSIEVQYGEQRGIFSYSALLSRPASTGDSLFGVYNDKEEFIAIFDTIHGRIASLALIDYGVYYLNKPTNSNCRFVKISRCDFRGSIEDFVLGHFFADFPPRVLFNGSVHDLKYNISSCSSFGSLSIFGDSSIVHIESIDKENDSTVWHLVIYEPSQRKGKNYKLRNFKNQAILQKD